MRTSNSARPARASRRATVAALACVGSLATLGASTRALAQNDPATAQSLFNEAKQLLKSGKYGLACPKLEESQRLDPAIGTLFNLAECNQHLGKTASAWAQYLEVAAEAKSHQQTAREKAARERAAALEPKIPHLIVNAGPSATNPGFELRRDGMEVGRAQWGTAVPVDPGEHVFRASASGKRAWESRITAEAGPARTVNVPALEDVPATTPVAGAAVAGAAPPPGTTASADVTTGVDEGAPSSHEGLSAPRAVAIAAAGLGLVGVGLGTYFGLASKSNHDDAEAHCRGNTCDDVGLSLRNDALDHGTISTIAFIAGGALIAGGVVVWLVAPDASREGSATAMRPSLGLTPTGVLLHGSF